MREAVPTLTSPSSLEKYASSIVGWSTDSIMAAMRWKNANEFQNPDGSARPTLKYAATSKSLVTEILSEQDGQGLHLRCGS